MGISNKIHFKFIFYIEFLKIILSKAFSILELMIFNLIKVSFKIYRIVEKVLMELNTFEGNKYEGSGIYKEYGFCGAFDDVYEYSNESKYKECEYSKKFNYYKGHEYSKGCEINKEQQFKDNIYNKKCDYKDNNCNKKCKFKDNNYSNGCNYKECKFSKKFNFNKEYDYTKCNNETSKSINESDNNSKFDKYKKFYKIFFDKYYDQFIKYIEHVEFCEYYNNINCDINDREYYNNEEYNNKDETNINKETSINKETNINNEKQYTKEYHINETNINKDENYTNNETNINNNKHTINKHKNIRKFHRRKYNLYKRQPFLKNNKLARTPNIKIKNFYMKLFKQKMAKYYGIHNIQKYLMYSERLINEYRKELEKEDRLKKIKLENLEIMENIRRKYGFEKRKTGFYKTIESGKNKNGEVEISKINFENLNESVVNEVEFYNLNETMNRINVDNINVSSVNREIECDSLNDSMNSIIESDNKEIELDNLNVDNSNESVNEEKNLDNLNVDNINVSSVKEEVEMDNINQSINIINESTDNIECESRDNIEYKTIDNKEYEKIDNKNINTTTNLVIYINKNEIIEYSDNETIDLDITHEMNNEIDNETIIYTYNLDDSYKDYIDSPEEMSTYINNETAHFIDNETYSDSYHEIADYIDDNNVLNLKNVYEEQYFDNFYTPQEMAGYIENKSAFFIDNDTAHFIDNETYLDGQYGMGDYIDNMNIRFETDDCINNFYSAYGMEDYMSDGFIDNTSEMKYNIDNREMKYNIDNKEMGYNIDNREMKYSVDSTFTLINNIVGQNKTKNYGYEEKKLNDESIFTYYKIKRPRKRYLDSFFY